MVVLAGALPPVTYFGYEGHPSRMVESGRLLALGAPGEPVADYLEALAGMLGAPAWQDAAPAPLPAQQGRLTPAAVSATVARLLPGDAIVSVEGGTCGYPFYAASAASARHTALTNTGGAIGQGLPVALGAAIASPGRRVVALLSDGSTQYTVQTLWSLAHENLPVVVLIAANHQYGILRKELARGEQPGPQAEALTSLDRPRIDWTRLADGYGVPSSRVETAEELAEAFAAACARPGPTLIEMQL